LDIASKDLLQILRDWKTFLFLLFMPVIFTLMFGFAFGGFAAEKSDPRLPVGYLDQGHGQLSADLYRLLLASQVIRLVDDPEATEAGLEKSGAGEDLAAAIVVPAGYSQAAIDGAPERLALIVDTSSQAGTTAQAEILVAATRLANAASAAQVIAAADDTLSFETVFAEALAAWEQPPVQIETHTSAAVEVEEPDQTGMSLAHTSPGMMIQFAIAGLLVAANIIVNERRTRVLQRLLTTATAHSHILLGHYLAIFTIIFIQFVLLVAFGQLVLKVDYMRSPVATLLIMVSSVGCIAGMGLLIGVLAKSEEQAIIYSLIPMFILSGLGGAWMPLEFTAKAFQAVGHLSPVAWAMDGFKNITIRGLGLESAIMPALALAGYGLVFFLIAVWRLRASEQQP
ncbi:MAG: ABC transporter permease, partial [Chloroflexota bacterium]